MKKLISILLCAVLCAACIAPAALADSGIGVTVNGRAVSWTDAAPFIDGNNRTLCPLRAVADAMGLDVAWNGDARTATFSLTSTEKLDDGTEYRYVKSLVFTIDSSTAAWKETFYYSDGSENSSGWPVTMDTAAVIVNSRTYAPVRYLAEAFDFGVGWDAGTRTVQVYDYMYWYDTFAMYRSYIGITFDKGKGYANLKSVELISARVDGVAASTKVMTGVDKEPNT